MIAVRESGDHEGLVRGHIGSFASLAALRALRLAGPSGQAEIAARIGTTESETDAVLDELRAAGLVEMTPADGGPLFTLTSHPAVRAAIEAVLDRYEQERHFRTRLVLDILRRMSATPSHV